MSFSQSEYQKQIMQGVDIGGDEVLSLGGLPEDLEDDVEVEVDEQNAVQEDGEEVEVEQDEGEPAPDTYDKDTVQKIIRTRVKTYEKRLERMNPYKQAVEKIGEITGLSPEDLLSRLDAMSETEQAQILGITPEQVRATKSARGQLRETQQNTRSLQRDMDIMKLKADPHFKDIELFKEEIVDLLEDNPKLSVKQAYLAVKGDLALTAAARDAEERATTRQVVNAQKKVVKPGAGGTALAVRKISGDVVAAAHKVGMDPAEYAAYQGIDNLDSYRNSKKKK